MDFISALEVINSVASQVPLQEEWKDGVLDHAYFLRSTCKGYFKSNSSESTRMMKFDSLNSLFFSAYRDSKAAGGLDYFLDCPNEETLDWFDMGQTGWPKVSIAARTEGLAMLVHMSRYFERYEKAYLSGRFDSWPESSDIQSYEGQFAKREDAQRLKEIGFNRTKLIEFLNKNKIPHSLSNSSYSPAIKPLSDAVKDPSFPINQPEVVSHLDAGLNNSSQSVLKIPPSNSLRVHLINGRKHVLADLIAMAQDHAGDRRNEVRIVFGFLMMMAESGDHIPLLRSLVHGRSIEFLSGQGYIPYTQGALGKYLDPSKRGKKKSTSKIENKKC